MSNFDSNPFGDPFQDGSVTKVGDKGLSQPDLSDYNPFASSQGTAVVQPSNIPDYGSNHVSAPPVAAPSQPTATLGQDELLKRQEELEKKAEELQRMEQLMSSTKYNPRANNWPPLPSCCPVGSCFYQDFSVDIPYEFQRTVKLLYYLWMFYALTLFLNVFTSLGVFIVDSSQGTGFGLAILWFAAFTPCSLCWYRPVYKAFRSDSSFNFFFFFFIMFFQVSINVQYYLKYPVICCKLMFLLCFV